MKSYVLQVFSWTKSLASRKKLVLHTAVVGEIEFKDDYSFVPPPIDTFIKVGWGMRVNYGDGGLKTLIYPLFVCRCLQLHVETKTTLINALDALGRKRSDWHDECPVLDIIDPDLAPNYYFTLNNTVKISERSKYAWFPLDVLVRSDESLKLLGPIHNLPPRGNTDLYKSIFTVFKKMLPGFRKLGIGQKGQDYELQVVVKAQKYVIAPGTSYSGKWHVEGRTENIVAGGVYYCKIDEGFEEDVVVFRPRVGPGTFYAETSAIPMENEKILLKDVL